MIQLTRKFGSNDVPLRLKLLLENNQMNRRKYLDRLLHNFQLRSDMAIKIRCQIRAKM